MICGGISHYKYRVQAEKRGHDLPTRWECETREIAENVAKQLKEDNWTNITITED